MSMEDSRDSIMDSMRILNDAVNVALRVVAELEEAARAGAKKPGVRDALERILADSAFQNLAYMKASERVRSARESLAKLILIGPHLWLHLSSSTRHCEEPFLGDEAISSSRPGLLRRLRTAPSNDGVGASTVALPMVSLATFEMFAQSEPIIRERVNLDLQSTSAAHPNLPNLAACIASGANVMQLVEFFRTSQTGNDIQNVGELNRLSRRYVAHGDQPAMMIDPDVAYKQLTDFLRDAGLS